MEEWSIGGMEEWNCNLKRNPESLSRAKSKAKEANHNLIPKAFGIETCEAKQSLSVWMTRS